MKMTMIERIVLGMIAALVLLLCVSVFFLVKTLGKAGDEIEQKGLKGVVSELWEGTNAAK
jgi:competence protein ComGC